MYLHHLCILCRWNNTVYLVLNIPFKLKSILQAFVFSWYKVLKTFLTVIGQFTRTMT